MSFLEVLREEFAHMYYLNAWRIPSIGEKCVPLSLSASANPN